MRAKILKIESKPSKYSTTLPFYYFFFKNFEGKSFRSCISPIYRNYSRWYNLVEKAKQGEIWLDGLVIKTVKGEEIVDADSYPRVIDPIPQEEKPIIKQESLFSDYDKGKVKLREAMEVLK